MCANIMREGQRADHNTLMKCKSKGKRDRPISPSSGPRSQSKDSKHGTGEAKVPKGTSSSGKPNRPSCCSVVKGKFTKPSCDDWPPSEFVKYKLNGGCKWEISVRFFIQTTVKRQARSRKRTRHPSKRPMQLHPVIRKKKKLWQW